LPPLFEGDEGDESTPASSYSRSMGTEFMQADRLAHDQAKAAIGVMIKFFMS
jgi:hypothetical protein